MIFDSDTYTLIFYVLMGILIIVILSMSLVEIILGLIEKSVRRYCRKCDKAITVKYDYCGFCGAKQR